MELIYPYVIYIGVPLLTITLFLLLILRLDKSDNYKDGKKVANTKYIKSLPYYRSLLNKYKMLSFLLIGICIICICLSLLLAARPAQTETINTPVYSRDIFLCMDVSGSLESVNGQLVERMKELVQSLRGERFGIAIFNTTSILLLPLTDDYDVVLEVLEEISDSLSRSYYYYDDYLYAGVLTGAEERGTSLIGDGLASCVFYFPESGEDRTRFILFSSDNRLEGRPVVTLQQAAEIAESKSIIVYGIAPYFTGLDTPSDKSEFITAMETTGGKLYIEDSSTRMSDIVSQIEQSQQSLMEGPKETKQIDKPEIPFIILSILVLLLFLLIRKVNL